MEKALNLLGGLNNYAERDQKVFIKLNVWMFPSKLGSFTKSSNFSNTGFSLHRYWYAYVSLGVH